MRGSTPWGAAVRRPSRPRSRGELKYFSPDTDYDALQRELAAERARPLRRSRCEEPADTDDDEDDEYADWSPGSRRATESLRRPAAERPNRRRTSPARSRCLSVLFSWSRLAAGTRQPRSGPAPCSPTVTTAPPTTPLAPRTTSPEPRGAADRLPRCRGPRPATPRAASRSTRRRRRGRGRRTATMPTPRLSVRSRSARGTPPSRATRSKTGGGSPGAAVDHGVDAVGEHPGQVGGEPAAGDVRDGVQVRRRGAGEVEQRRRRRSGSARAAPHRGCGRTRRRAARSPTPRGRRPGGPASSRWSAARSTGHRDDGVAGPHPVGARAPRRPRRRRTRRRRRRTRPVPAGRGAPRSRRPTKAQPARSQPAAMPATIGGDPLRHHPAAGDVVGHHQGSWRRRPRRRRRPCATRSRPMVSCLSMARATATLVPTPSVEPASSGRR